MRFIFELKIDSQDYGQISDVLNGLSQSLIGDEDKPKVGDTQQFFSSPLFPPVREIGLWKVVED